MNNVNSKPVFQYETVTKAPGKAAAKVKKLANPKKLLKIMKKVGKQLDRPRQAAKNSETYKTRIKPQLNPEQKKLSAKAESSANKSGLSKLDRKIDEGLEKAGKRIKAGVTSYVRDTKTELQKSWQDTKESVSKYAYKAGFTDPSKMVETKEGLKESKEDIKSAGRKIKQAKKYVSGKLSKGFESAVKKTSDYIATETGWFDTPNTLAK